MGLSLQASSKRWAVAGPKASLIPSWAQASSKDQAVSKDLAEASSMVQAEASSKDQAVSKDLAVASSMAQAACSKGLAVASSMVQAACSKDLAVSMVRAWAQQACPKELSVASSMVLQGAMACSLSKLASSKNRARSWPTCFSAP